MKQIATKGSEVFINVYGRKLHHQKTGQNTIVFADLHVKTTKENTEVAGDFSNFQKPMLHRQWVHNNLPLSQ